MKHFIVATLVVIFGASAWSYNSGKRVAEPIKLPPPNGGKDVGGPKIPPNVGGDPTIPSDPNTDDMVPWPWGTECPFPWNKVDGQWLVKGKYGQTYDRDTLTFETAEDTQAGVKILYIFHYDNGGRLLAKGVGYSNSDNKIIKAIMTSVRGLEYNIIVRTYAKTERMSCRSGKLSMAATFCPSRGKKCLENQNYLLLK